MEEKKVTVEEQMTPEEVLAAMLKYIRGLRKEVGIIKKSMVSEQKLSYSNQDLMDMFHITSPTLKKWRDTGLIGFSQIGSIYLYSKEDIENFLRDTHYESFSSTKRYRKSLKELKGQG